MVRHTPVRLTSMMSTHACARPCPRATPVMNATFFSAGIAPPSAVAWTCRLHLRRH